VDSMALSSYLTGFVDPSPLAFAFGMFCLWFSLHGIKKRWFAASGYLFLGTVGYLAAEFFTIDTWSPNLPPFFMYLLKHSIIPLAGFYSMKKWQGVVVTVLSLALYLQCFLGSIGKTYVFTGDDLIFFFALGFSIQLFPVYCLIVYQKDMSLFYSLLDKFLSVSEEKSKEKTTFISRMSHELRTPLHGLLSSVGLLRRTGVTDEQSTFLSTMESCGEVILDVITKILDITKIESGDFHKDVMDFNLFDMVKGVSDSVAVLIEAHPIDFSISFEPHPLGYDAKGDKTHLREILLNVRPTHRLSSPSRQLINPGSSFWETP